MNINVLLATHNRKNFTLNCLKSLYNQKLAGDITFDVFITDDASADGTVEAVMTNYPKVKIFHGSGSLFWAGGMRNSWREAVKTNPDFYLLLNDDTELNDKAIERLLAYYELQGTSPAICIGSTKDPADASISYGGQKLYNPKKAQYYTVYSNSEWLDCDMANANIMLVHRAVVAKIGILSDHYTHSIADFDYTIRARKAGYKVALAPGILGYCTDDHGNNWKSGAFSLNERIKYLKSPKGLAYDEYLKFIRLHFPFYLPSAFIKLWMKTLFPVMWDKFK